MSRGVDARDMTSSTETPPQPLIICLHLPKTGGTTLVSIMRRQYSPDAVAGLGVAQPALAPIQRAAQALFPHTAVAHTNLRVGLHAFLARESTYITLLRDPVERVISQYFHILRDPSWSPHQTLHAERISLKSWASSGRFPRAANLQTARLSGADPSDRPCPAALLQQAKRNLRERFSVVGITERFDETAIMLKRAFHWRSVLYTSQNVGANRPHKASIDAGTLRAIEDANRLDIELYDYARGIFEEQLSRQPADFEMELEAFRRMNRHYDGHPSIFRR